MTPRIVAIVPMRGQSERVPGKNYRPLAGKPLFHYVIESLLAARPVAEVVVDTDSPALADRVREAFPRLRIIDRPAHLHGGHTPMNAVLAHDVTQVAADYYLQTHTTNPLLRSATITAGVLRFLETRPAHDSLFGVTRLQTRLYFEDGRAINHDPKELLRTQDLPPVYEENSNLYLFTRETLERKGHRIGDRPLMFEIPREEAWDIDEEVDFAVAEFLMERRRRSE